MVEIEYVIYDNLKIWKKGSMFDDHQIWRQWKDSVNYKYIDGSAKTIKLQSGKAVKRDRLYNFCFNGGSL